jgi:hypothetical protein
MLSFFKSSKKPSAQQDNVLSYVGVASTHYGTDFDLALLVSGQYNELFKKKFQFVMIAGSKTFDNYEEALKHTSRRGVSSCSAYVIGLNCPIDEIDTYREKGKFSNLIVSITNAITKEPVAENSDLLKPKRKDDNFDRPHSPPIKVL